MKITIFGGSFNPFTNVHLKIIRDLLDDTSDLIAPVVSTENPFKISGDISEPSKYMAPYLHRVNMAEIALKNELIRQEYDYISFGRMMMKYYPAPLRSWHFVDWFINKSNKDYKPTLVFGEDVEQEFDKFERVDFLKKHAKILFIKETNKIHATDIRQMILDNDSEWELHVPSSVADYIKLHSLFKE